MTYHHWEEVDKTWSKHYFFLRIYEFKKTLKRHKDAAKMTLIRYRELNKNLLFAVTLILPWQERRIQSRVWLIYCDSSLKIGLQIDDPGIHGFQNLKICWFCTENAKMKKLLSIFKISFFALRNKSFVAKIDMISLLFCLFYFPI